MSDANSESTEFIEQAIERVLDQVPGAQEGTTSEESVKLQPWAEKAAPPGKNKRPLEQLLAEYAERVHAAPDAMAYRPATLTPDEVFFQRFIRSAPSPRKGRQRRRWGGRRRPDAAAAGAATPPAKRNAPRGGWSGRRGGGRPPQRRSNPPNS